MNLKIQLCLIMAIVMVAMSSSLEESDRKEELTHEQTEVKEILQLPMPDEPSSRTLGFGETLAFDELGPIIINKDGSLRRITNWSELTADEKKHTSRKVSLRNQKRLGVLKNNERLETIRQYYEQQAIADHQLDGEATEELQTDVSPEESLTLPSSYSTPVAEL